MAVGRRYAIYQKGTVSSPSAVLKSQPPLDIFMVKSVG
jgi:hypothetical protein